MGTDNPRTYRFSDVVRAIETTPKSLRNWLQRKQVNLVADTAERTGWREFTHDDLLQLALIRKLVDYGMEVTHASAWTADLVRRVGDLLDAGIFVLWKTPDGDWKHQVMSKYPVEGEAPKLLPVAYLTINVGDLIDAAVRRSEGL